MLLGLKERRWTWIIYYYIYAFLQYITRIYVQVPAMKLDTYRSRYIMEFVRILNSFSLILFFFFCSNGLLLQFVFFSVCLFFFIEKKETKKTVKQKKKNYRKLPAAVLRGEEDGCWSDPHGCISINLECTSSKQKHKKLLYCF